MKNAFVNVYIEPKYGQVFPEKELIISNLILMY